MTQKLYFQDLEIGQTFELGRTKLSKTDIIEFATEFDPQAFHLDDEAAKRVFGGLAASGLHTMSIYQRLMVDNFLKKVDCLGGAGLDSCKFVKPVLAELPLNALLTIADKRQSESKPNRGLVTLKCETLDDQDNLLMTMSATIVVGLSE
jgi:acyl dehydratase